MRFTTISFFIFPSCSVQHCKKCCNQSTDIRKVAGDADSSSVSPQRLEVTVKYKQHTWRSSSYMKGELRVDRTRKERCVIT